MDCSILFMVTDANRKVVQFFVADCLSAFSIQQSRMWVRGACRLRSARVLWSSRESRAGLSGAQLQSAFERATAAAGRLDLDNEQKLRVYSLFKQVSPLPSCLLSLHSLLTATRLVLSVATDSQSIGDSFAYTVCIESAVAGRRVQETEAVECRLRREVQVGRLEGTRQHVEGLLWAHWLFIFILYRSFHIQAALNSLCFLIREMFGH